MNSRETLREGTGVETPQWVIKHWVDAGIFLATASVLVLPRGANSWLILPICCILYLIHHQHQPGPGFISRYELWFPGSMILYPLAVVLFLVSAEPFERRYFENPSRFLLVLPIYWAIRKSRTTPDSLVMGAIIGAAGAGVLAIYQWAALDYARPHWNNERDCIF